MSCQINEPKHPNRRSAILEAEPQNGPGARVKGKAELGFPKKPTGNRDFPRPSTFGAQCFQTDAGMCQKRTPLIPEKNNLSWGPVLFLDVFVFIIIIFWGGAGGPRFSSSSFLRGGGGSPKTTKTFLGTLQLGVPMQPQGLRRPRGPLRSAEALASQLFIERSPAAGASKNTEQI